MRTFWIVAGLSLLQIAAVAPARDWDHDGDEETVKEDCYGGRCVYHDAYGHRLGSIEADDTDRLRVSDASNRLVGKISRDEDRLKFTRRGFGR